MDVTCKHGEVLPSVRLPREMQRPPRELGERLEEDGDEGVDVPGSLFCSLDSLAVFSVRESNADPGLAMSTQKLPAVQWGHTAGQERICWPPHSRSMDSRWYRWVRHLPYQSGTALQRPHTVRRIEESVRNILT